MKPARFAYHAATSVADAVAALAGAGDAARPIAGGQSLGPMLNMRVAQPDLLVDLNGIAELATVIREGECLRVGAMVRQHDVARDPDIARDVPLLAHAAGTIGHYATRQRGTIGGSLVHADPAAQLPAVALALGAEMELVGPRGGRRVAARDFFLATFETAVAADELLVAVRWPIRRPGEGWGFRLVARRAGDFAVALAAVRLAPSGELRCVLGGVAPTPLVLGGEVSADAEWATRFAAEAAASLDLDDEPRRPAAYRREIAAFVVEAACREAALRRGTAA